MACSTACLKSTLLVFNSILLLVGCILLGIGIWIVSNSSSFTNENKDLYFSWNLPYSRSISYQSTMVILGFFSTVIGSTIILLGFIGGYGALRGSSFLLSLSLFSLLFIFICLLTAAIFVFVYSGQIGDWLKNVMEDETKRQVQNGILSRAHRHFDKCCGIDDSEENGGICNINAIYPNSLQIKIQLANSVVVIKTSTFSGPYCRVFSCLNINSKQMPETSSSEEKLVT